MTLRDRLRAAIVVLAATIVITLSVLTVDHVASLQLQDVAERAQLTTEDVKNFLLPRLDTPPARLAADPALSSFLVHVLTNSTAFTEVSIADMGGRTLASSSGTQTGKLLRTLPNFAEWQRQSLTARLWDLFRAPHSFGLIAMPAPDSSAPPYQVQLVISSVLLRHALQPQLTDLLWVSISSLLVSIALAVVVSNVATRPLMVIGQQLDRIAANEGRPSSGVYDVGLSEISAVHSKLTLLGEQMQGARADAAELRRNVNRMLERLEEAVLLFDADGKVIMAGRPAERLLGRSHEQLIQQSYQEVFPPWTPQGALVAGALRDRRALHDEAVTWEQHGLPTLRLIMSLEFPDSTGADASLGAIMTLRDADTRREIESQLDVAGRLTAINRLTSGTAHEMRNPLNAITLHLEVLKAKLADPQPVAGELAVIQREITRLDRVIRTFVEFTRPMDIRMGEIDLGTLTQEVCRHAQASLTGSPIKLNHQAPGDPLVVRGDRESLYRALQHVVQNGVEAMEAGGSVTIQVQRVFDDCLVLVTDTGAGIPAEIQDKVFNLFYSTKPNAAGIGLAVAFQVVQLHNGAIDFQSQPQQGTTFRLRFPLFTPEAPARPTVH